MTDSKQSETAKDHKQVTIGDIGKDTEQLTTVKVDDLMPLPGDVDFADKDFEPLPDSVKEKYACILDDVNILQIPNPKSKEEEEELVNKFLDGMRKLFDPQNNWTTLSMLETTSQRAEALFERGVSLDEAIAAAPNADYDEQYGRWYIKPADYLMFLYKSLENRPAR